MMKGIPQGRQDLEDIQRDLNGITQWFVFGGGTNEKSCNLHFE